MVREEHESAMNETPSMDIEPGNMSPAVREEEGNGNVTHDDPPRAGNAECSQVIIPSSVTHGFQRLVNTLAQIHQPLTTRLVQQPSPGPATTSHLGTSVPSSHEADFELILQRMETLHAEHRAQVQEVGDRVLEDFRRAIRDGDDHISRPDNVRDGL